jgi:hypothetical protein
MCERTGSVCQAIACERPATGSYQPTYGGAGEFALCGAHLSRMRAGERPAVVAERFDLADLGGPLALLFQ